MFALSDKSVSDYPSSTDESLIFKSINDMRTSMFVSLHLFCTCPTLLQWSRLLQCCNHSVWWRSGWKWATGRSVHSWDQLLSAFKWWLADYWKTNEGESLVWETEAQLAVSCYASWVCKDLRWWSKGVSLWNEEWFPLISTACSLWAWFTLSYFTKAETLSLFRYDLNCSVLLQRLTQLTQGYVGSHFYPLLAKDLKLRVKVHTVFTYFCCTDFSF